MQQHPMKEQMTFKELSAAYPHMVDGDDAPTIEDDTVFNIIEFTNYQFMAWGTGGPITEILAVTMDESLTTVTVTHLLMSSMLQGD